MSRILRIFLAIAAIALTRPALAQDASPTPINDVYVIHLVIDGTNYETLQRVIDKGKMPTLKKTFIDNGAVFTKAMSTFPSTSTCAYQSFATGLLPGHAGIPHLQRFDRQREEYIDYLSLGNHTTINGDLINLKALLNSRHADLDTPSIIFELLAGHPTASMYTTIRRGTTIREPEHIPLHAAWSTYVSENYSMIDVLAYDKLINLYGGPLEKIPRYALVGLYSSDVAGHHLGTAATMVEDVLIQFDYFLRDFLDLLDRQGIRDKTYIIVSPDHGMHDTHNLFLFRNEMLERGIAVKPKNPRRNDFNVYAATRGVSSTHLYTRRADGTFSPLQDADELRSYPSSDGERIDLIEYIRGLEPVDLVIVRDGEDGVMVYDRAGNASRIECLALNGADWCSYEILSSGDPLRLTSKRARRLADGTPHHSQEWKWATADEYYTDAVIQLGTIFQDGRAGDLFIIPKRWWGFRKVKKATHGSLIRDDMHIAMFMTGPTVPRGTFQVMRTVDVFPLLVEWFGLTIDPAQHDGVNPFEGYRPEDPRWQKLATAEQMLRHGNAPSKSLLRDAQPYARIELKRRAHLHERLKEYITRLDGQREDTRAPGAANHRYVDDHLAIARRIKRLTAQRKEVMERIVNDPILLSSSRPHDRRR